VLFPLIIRNSFELPGVEKYIVPKCAAKVLLALFAVVYNVLLPFCHAVATVLLAFTIALLAVAVAVAKTLLAALATV
jgi:hypothetical protein